MADTCDTSAKSWLGSSLKDIYSNQGPWAYNVTPITASYYHQVVYEFPLDCNGSNIPRPRKGSKQPQWNEDHVRLPYSEHNLYPTVENDKEVIVQRWTIIRQALSSQKILTIEQLEKSINSYNNNNLPKFEALHRFFDEGLDYNEREYFFQTLLPRMVKLALDLPDILPCQAIRLLKRHHNRSLSLSQQQIASLLANAFFCTFPWKQSQATTYPGVNFVRLFAADKREKRRESVGEKLKCLFNYFTRVTEQMPTGVVTFERKFLPSDKIPKWSELNRNLGNTKIHINSDGTIEANGKGCLQVDFANKNVGGGVLSYGCVQEEIRFVINPELIISRLFLEQLGDTEAVVVTGTEQFNSYHGYSDDFKWGGNYVDETPLDEFRRRRTTISIIDATKFNRIGDQFTHKYIMRELNKAYVGFSSYNGKYENLPPVATGNWGCGAFRGSKYLKALLQLMACSANRRHLIYYSFGEIDIRDDFYNMHLFLATHQITISQLLSYLKKFISANSNNNKIKSEPHLYAFIQQAYFDDIKPNIVIKATTPSTSEPVQEIQYQNKTNNNVIEPSNEASSTAVITTQTTTSSSSSSCVNNDSRMSLEIEEFSDIERSDGVESDDMKSKRLMTSSEIKSPPMNEIRRKKLPKTDVIDLFHLYDNEEVISDNSTVVASKSSDTKSNILDNEVANTSATIPGNNSSIRKTKISDYFISKK